MVEREPAALPWPHSEGVLIEEKVELSGDDDIVAVRECNDDVEGGISLVFLWRFAAMEEQSGQWIGADKGPKPRVALPLAESDKGAGATTTMNKSRRWTEVFLLTVGLTLNEDSTNLSRDVSISSKPFRHDDSLPTADQLPFKQVDIAYK
jgi:hypothetical protein